MPWSRGHRIWRRPTWPWWRVWPRPITRLLTNAKAAGSIRTDVTFSDIAIILLSVRAVEDRYEVGAAGE